MIDSLPAQPSPTPHPTPSLGRRPWWKRIGHAVLIWGLEALIGLIPYAAHAASMELEDASKSHVDGNAAPEICVLAVVASALALLSLLRDWFKGENKQANELTVVFGIANLLACLAGAYLYPLAVNGLLTTTGYSIPRAVLAAALLASFLLAVERGFSCER